LPATHIIASRRTCCFVACQHYGNRRHCAIPSNLARASPVVFVAVPTPQSQYCCAHPDEAFSAAHLCAFLSTHSRMFARPHARMHTRVHYRTRSPMQRGQDCLEGEWCHRTQTCWPVGLCKTTTAGATTALFRQQCALSICTQLVCTISESKRLAVVAAIHRARAGALTVGH
jgi:hypothetical protein